MTWVFGTVALLLLACRDSSCKHAAAHLGHWQHQFIIRQMLTLTRGHKTPRTTATSWGSCLLQILLIM